MSEMKDQVSDMQDAVDDLALSMFDSLRLLPSSTAFERDKICTVGQPNQGRESVSRHEAVVTDDVWASRVKDLAEGVLKKAAWLDHLIDVLPGADLREDQQLQEIARLDKEGRQMRAKLAKMTDEAEDLRKEVNYNLDRLADHMLNAPS